MDTLIAILIVAGAAFALIAAIGTLRFPDALSRMHAATKAGSFGAGLLLVAAALFFGSVAVALEALLIISLFYLTAPIAAQLIGQSARRPSEYDSANNDFEKTKG